MIARFGAYEILFELKSGGMGAVLLGRRRGPGAFEQLVAIKTIRQEYANAESVRAMFLDEAAILARLGHPGVATVHDFGEENGALYMVMEYVAGIPFRELIDMRPPPEVSARAIAEACRGLNAAHELRDLAGHELGLVHRDISPDNLMLGFDGHVKVIDFGIALVKNRQAPVTEFGTVKGKPPYMSPEQVKNEPMDRRSDVFSLGTVAWELLTGRGLFEGDSLYAIAYAVDNQEIQPPSKLAGAMPSGLDAAVLHALQRDPGKRTATAAAFAEELELVLNAFGGETLESWADRELKVVREAHREWLASVAAGGVKPKPGRATGSHTEMAPLGLAQTEGRVVKATPIVKPDAVDGLGATAPQTSVGAGDGDVFGTAPSSGGAAGRGRAPSVDALVPRRRLLLPLVLALFVLLAVGGGIALMMRGDDKRVVKDATVAVDRPADAGKLVMLEKDASAPVDAAVDAAELVPVDAAVAVDAGHGKRPPGHRDASVVAVTVDAAAPQAVGSGFITILPRDSSSVDDATLDGELVRLPYNKHELHAGPHVVKFVQRGGSQVIDTQQVTIENGKAVTVRER